MAFVRGKKKMEKNNFILWSLFFYPKLFDILTFLHDFFKSEKILYFEVKIKAIWFLLAVRASPPLWTCVWFDNDLLLFQAENDTFFMAKSSLFYYWHQNKLAFWSKNEHLRAWSLTAPMLHILLVYLLTNLIFNYTKQPLLLLFTTL